MAKLTCEFDTVEKTCKIMKDGATIEKAHGLEIYPSYDGKDKFSCRIYISEYDEKSEIHTTTYMSASKTGELVEKTIPALFGQLKHTECDEVAEETPIKSLAKMIASHRSK